MNNKEDITVRIKDIIYKKGMTISQFAQGANIDQSNLSSILNGKRRIGSGVITKISLAYNINTEWLTTGTGDIYRKAQNLSEPNADYINDKYKDKYIEQLEREIILLKSTIDEQWSIINGFMKGDIQKIK